MVANVRCMQAARVVLWSAAIAGVLAFAGSAYLRWNNPSAPWTYEFLLKDVTR